MNVLDGLRNTSKGQLQYDRDWNATKSALDTCSRSPTLPSELSAVIDLLERVSLRESPKERKKSPNESSFQRVPARDQSLSFRGPEHFDETHVNLYNLEQEMKLEAKERLAEIELRLARNSAKLQERKKCTLRRVDEEKSRRYLQQMQDLEQDLQICDLKAEKDKKALAIQHEKSAARASRKVKHVDELKKKMVAEEERRNKEMLMLRKYNQDIHNTYVDLEMVIKNCKFQDQLKPRVAAISQQAKNVLSLSDNSLNYSISIGQPADNALHQLLECCKIMKTLLDKARQAVTDTENKVKKEMAEREAKKKEEEEELKRKEEAKKKEEQVKAASASQKLSSHISKTSAEEYKRLEKLLEQTTKSLDTFISSTDKTIKKLKMALQRAITTPINAISDQSPAHLEEKIKSLSDILSGKQVDSFGKQLSTSMHPNAPLYCRHIVALRIVQQGSQQVSSNHNAAFPIAVVAIGLWSAFPDVGDLILSQFYKQCPFLVPMYIPRAEGVSDKDYFQTLGYLCENGEIEPRDKYLKRISGTIRLYAAVVSSLPPKRLTTSHPHGIQCGWMWLARILNLPPKADYTATALFEFLDVAGHALQKLYRNQFWKLILVIVREMIPKIRQITSPSQSGPVVRLEGFLEKAFQLKSMKRPEGYLDNNWWNSAGFSGIYGN